MSAKSLSMSSRTFLAANSLIDSMALSFVPTGPSKKVLNRADA